MIGKVRENQKIDPEVIKKFEEATQLERNGMIRGDWDLMNRIAFCLVCGDKDMYVDAEGNKQERDWGFSEYTPEISHEDGNIVGTENNKEENKKELKETVELTDEKKTEIEETRKSILRNIMADEDELFTFLKGSNIQSLVHTNAPYTKEIKQRGMRLMGQLHNYLVDRDPVYADYSVDDVVEGKDGVIMESARRGYVDSRQIGGQGPLFFDSKWHNGLLDSTNIGLPNDVINNTGLSLDRKDLEDKEEEDDNIKYMIYVVGKNKKGIRFGILDMNNEEIFGKLRNYDFHMPK